MSSSRADDSIVRHDPLFQQAVAESGLVSPDQLDFSLDIQQSLAMADSLMPLGVVLLRRGYLTLSQASHILSSTSERLLYCDSCQAWRYEEVTSLQVGTLTCASCQMDLPVSPEDFLLLESPAVSGSTTGAATETGPVAQRREPTGGPAIERPGPAELIGTALRGYVVEELVSEGRYEGWFRAFDAVREKTLMFRAIPLRFRRSKELFERLREDFYRVKRVAAHAKPDSFDLVELQDDFYVTQVPVEGRSLAEIARAGRSTVDDVLKIAIPVAELAVAGHRQDLVDFDFDPEHIVVDNYGRVKLMDVSTGFLRRDEADAVRYRAPERIARRPVNEPADIYSFHAICYLLLAGEPAISGDGLMDVAEAVMQGEFVPLREALPDLEPAMADLVQKGMSLAPSARPQDFSEVLDNLRHIPEMIRARKKELERRGTAAEKAQSEATGRQPTGRITVASIRDRMSPQAGGRPTHRVRDYTGAPVTPMPHAEPAVPEEPAPAGSVPPEPAKPDPRQQIAEYGRRAREFMKLKRYTLAIKALSRILEFEGQSDEFATEIANARKAIRMLEQHKNR